MLIEPNSIIGSAINSAYGLSSPTIFLVVSYAIAPPIDASASSIILRLVDLGILACPNVSTFKTTPSGSAFGPREATDAFPNALLRDILRTELAILVAVLIGCINALAP